jgi:hypothetical protein
MGEIHEIGASQPEDKKLYEQDYKKSAELFQKALDAHAGTTNPYKREEFKQVMNKAMHVMNQAARGLKDKSLQKQNEQIKKDYTAYQKGSKPEDLRRDLEQAKRSV